MRRFFVGLGIAMVAMFSANAGQIANVEYIHNLIENNWGVVVPFGRNLISPNQVANMEYLLTAVDVANEMIHGKPISSYGTGQYATRQVVDTVVTQQAVDNLISKARIPAVFEVTTTSDTQNFTFNLSASGTFYVDWGDGNVEKIEKTSVADEKFEHKYSVAGEYIIGFEGQATEYNTNPFVPSISFANNKNVGGISGKLGNVLGTLDNGNQPSFKTTFANCTNMKGEIPADLFDGIKGQTWDYMFSQLFDGCSGLTGNIPEDLFADLSGNFTKGLFESTFRGCSGLTGNIPEDLFATVDGGLGIASFFQLFAGCSGLSGTIPEGLFATIDGEPQESCMAEVFKGCNKLTGTIPENLFAGVKGKPAVSMFYETFLGCRGLRGPIPEKLFAGIDGEPAGSMFHSVFKQTGICGAIPEKLFAGVKGKPAPNMFDSSFVDCGVTSIPAGLFAGIDGEPAVAMFNRTFHWNPSLGSVPGGLFAGVYGAPAKDMFNSTFDTCPNVKEIAGPLFGDLSGDVADKMFYGMFNGATSLTGPSARVADGTYLYDIWELSSDQNTYSGASKLTDWAQIPDNWK